jgi:hypothetical protein
MNETSKLKHDFINNGLRIEVVNRLISEALEKNDEIDPNLVIDLDKFLLLQLKYTKQLVT